MENLGAGLLTGEKRNTLDDKGRMLFPADFRAVLPDNELVITRGLDRCLWLFSPSVWSPLSDKIMQSASLFDRKSRAVVRRLVAPAQLLDIEKSGRILIPQSLREYARLEKDCIILSIPHYFELWDVREYENYLQGSETDFDRGTEEFGDIGL